MRLKEGFGKRKQKRGDNVGGNNRSPERADSGGTTRIVRARVWKWLITVGDRAYIRAYRVSTLSFLSLTRDPYSFNMSGWQPTNQLVVIVVVRGRGRGRRHQPDLDFRWKRTTGGKHTSVEPDLDGSRRRTLTSVSFPFVSFRSTRNYSHFASWGDKGRIKGIFFFSFFFLFREKRKYSPRRSSFGSF